MLRIMGNKSQFGGTRGTQQQVYHLNWSPGTPPTREVPCNLREKGAHRLSPLVWGTREGQSGVVVVVRGAGPVTSVPSSQPNLLAKPAHIRVPKAESGHHTVFLPHKHQSVEAH